MSIYLHNTLTGKKEPFVPLKAGEVSLYVCGVTPYDHPHLGHGRCYVVFDLLKRMFQSQGFKVRHIQNYTDIDDKIIDRARQLNQPPVELAQGFIDSFVEAMRQLNVLPADLYPRVTEHIPDIILLIQSLTSKGLAYEKNGDVYYAVRRFPEYGRLSKRKIDELEAGARVEVSDIKKDPLDFALWKKAKPGEPCWDSPWGAGRPGWHIECSAMSMKYLGEDFDIHGGGQDLIFPHHENEAAQSVGATRKGFAHTWVHNGFVTINQEKMSKSLNNFFTLKDIFEKNDPMAVRYFLLTQHYRSPLNYSDQELKAAETAWQDRVVGSARRLADLMEKHRLALGSQGSTPALPPDFLEALTDDLNTPAALAVLNLHCGQAFTLEQELTVKNSLSSEDQEKVLTLGARLQAMLSVLGLRVPEKETWPEEVLALLRDRQEARQSKNWKRSDEIRDEFKKRGILVEDTANGPRLKRIL